MAGWAAWPCARAVAQTAVDGEVVGQVVDAAGHGVAGARVVLRAVDSVEHKDKAGPLEWLRAEEPSGEATTGAGGRFVVLRIEPGEYVAEMGVFGRGGGGDRVVVAAGEVSETRLVMGGGGGSVRRGAGSGAAAAEEVSGAERWLEPEAAWVEAEQAGGLRVAEVAGADSTEEEPGEAERGVEAGDAVGVSVDGLAGTQGAGSVDGIGVGENFRGGGRGEGAGARWGGMGMAAGAVRVPRFERSFSAEYGGVGGAVLAATTRRGGLNWHGAAGLAVRESAWAAGNPFAVETHFRDGVVTGGVVKPRDSDVMVLGRAGGPLFWRGVTGFAAVEERLRDAVVVASPQLAGFYALTPVQAALLGTRGVSAAQRVAALNYLDSLTGEVDRRVRQGREFVRLDAKAGARDHVALSYARTRLEEPAMALGALSEGVMARGRASVGDAATKLDAVEGRWVHVFSDRVNNEVRGLWGGELVSELPRAPLTQEPGISVGGFAPEVKIQGGVFSYGTPAALGRKAYPDEQRLGLGDVAQWAVARHVWTAGGEWSRVRERIDSLADAEGSFHYDSGGTKGRAGGLVDWITDYTFNVRAYPNGGCPTIGAAVHYFCFRSFTQSFGGAQTEFVEHELAAFVQDRWRLREGLTAELGARYEYVLLPLPQRPNGALDAGLATQIGSVGATNSFPEDRNNVGPRVSLAWSPEGGRWGTVRVGYGVFYGRLPGATVRAALEDTALASSTTRIHITPTTVTACPQVAAQGFGYPCAYVSAPPAAVAATTRALVFAKNFRLPAVQRAELAVERGWGRGLVLRAEYATAMATQLAKTRDVNIAGPGEMRTFVLQGGDGRAGVRDGETFAVPVYSQRLLTQFGAVSAVMSNANATWHAGRVEARVRGGGVEARASYTWSKAMDYGAEQRGVPRVDGQFDPFDVRYDKAVADTNVPQQVTGYAAWSSRLGAGPEGLRKVLGGWRLGILGSAGSGRPYSYEIFGGTRLSGGSYSMNGSGGATYLPTVGRNTLRMPMRWNADARVGRGFQMGERWRGEAYAEAFNVGNHVNATRVNARAFLVGDVVGGATQLVFQDAATVAGEGLNTAAFGTVTSSTAGVARERRAQVGLRLEF